MVLFFFKQLRDMGCCERPTLTAILQTAGLRYKRRSQQVVRSDHGPAQHVTSHSQASTPLQQHILHLAVHVSYGSVAPLQSLINILLTSHHAASTAAAAPVQLLTTPAGCKPSITHCCCCHPRCRRCCCQHPCASRLLLCCCRGVCVSWHGIVLLEHLDSLLHLQWQGNSQDKSAKVSQQTVAQSVQGACRVTGSAISAPWRCMRPVRVCSRS
jgi:hypothetical protein